MIQRGQWLGQLPLVRRPSLGQSSAVTDATFSQVLSAPKAVVEFWSPSCPVCVDFKPVFEDVAAMKGGEILMATAQTDDSQKSAASYGIQSIPALIFLVNGKEVHRIEGGMSKQDFLSEIDRAFAGTGVTSTPTTLRPAAGSSGPPVGGLVLGGIALAGIVAGAIYLIAQK